jgi:hypothetical protein
MVILDCPMCCASIVSYKNQTFPLSKKQMERIKNCKQESNVLKILHKITAQEPKVHCRHTNARNYHAFEKQSPMIRTGGDCISSDDIINLRIDLETCQDAASFIERI